MEQVVGAAIERCGGDDFVSGAGEGCERKRFSGLPRGSGQPRRSAFESRYALLEHVCCGVHDAGVDVAKLLEAEEAAGVVGVLKDVGRGLVDGHGTRSGGGVGGLAGMHGKGGKLLLLGFGHDLLLRGSVAWVTSTTEAGWGIQAGKRRNGPDPLDPGRLASRSVALSALSASEPRAGVRTPYTDTCTWP